MGALDVLPLDQAKLYLNASGTRDDAELETFIPPAVARVERHLGRSLIDAAEVAPLELLAVKVVLAEYWRTQRNRSYGGGGASYGSGNASDAAIEADSGPAGAAPLKTRLTELLGPAADDVPAVPGVPLGAFPPAADWPDPAVGPARGGCRW